MIGRSRQFFGLLGLTALLSLPGCLSCFNPVPDPSCETKQFCEQLPAPCRNGVYVVLLNGVDPLECGNISGVRDYLNGLGFVKTYYGQLYHEGCLLKELQAVHAEHPEAKFAIIGYEFGALSARNLARKAEYQDLPIDLLVYIQPKGLETFPDVAESNVGRRITIRGYKESSSDSSSEDGETISVPSYFRYAVPTNAATLEALSNELTSVALSVAIPAASMESFPRLLDDPAPNPRPIVKRKPEPVDDWDFLKPASPGKILEMLPMPPAVSPTAEK
jgi:hypothetical protein